MEKNLRVKRNEMIEEMKRNEVCIEERINRRDRNENGD